MFADIPAVIDDLKQGKMVVLLDDEDRENEGDLIMLAEHVQAKDINFMARYGRGLICLTLSRERCRQLRLPLMVSDTDSQRTTNFTLSIEAAEGITTGISAHDRALTVQAAVAKDAHPNDISQPGHIFPLMAQPGGVLARAGHTEAGCDLARLAGAEPAAVIVEILNEDGSMARRPDLEVFCKEHDIKMATIADLISYRLQNEVSIERLVEKNVPTDFGEFKLFAFDDHVHSTVHLALVKGEIQPNSTPLVRVHLQDTLSDVLSVKWKELGWPLRNAMQMISEQGEGVIVILRRHESPRELIEMIEARHVTHAASQTNEEPSRQLRTYGIGAQILRDLGVRKMRVLSAPTVMSGLSGFGLEVIEYIDENKNS
ncbi:MAG: 3,4-dihydroxy-2-butanone-4-phosphate synthase [Gammaproteobacteria bacterium]|nr:3,4-dihydroxy-2-butanone-4-phosphate synthase [Gammaproteobacteria bacterium]